MRDLTSEGSLIGQTRLISVYSLADNQYQMPFAMTLSSILSENEKVLLMDFQENETVTTDMTYGESWDFIKSGENSLKRHTNVNLLIKRLKAIAENHI